MNAFAERFGGPMPVGAPIPGAPGAAAPVSQPAPAPAPVMTPNAFAQHIFAPPSGGYGVRNMMPGAMPPASAGFRTGAPNPFNALRMRMGL